MTRYRTHGHALGKLVLAAVVGAGMGCQGGVCAQASPTQARPRGSMLGLLPKHRSMTLDMMFGPVHGTSQVAMRASQASNAAVVTVESPIDIRLDAGEIVWEGCTQQLIASRNQFAAMLAERGWTIRYTSAYRSLTYQEHLYLIAHTPLRRLGRAEAVSLRAERVRHQLSRTVARPGYGDRHVLGQAFDAVVFDEYGRTKNSRTWRDRRVEQIAELAGLHMLPGRLRDSVHFQLG